MSENAFGPSRFDKYGHRYFVRISGAVFTKGLSKVLGLSWLYFYTKVKPKTWLRPFVNRAPGVFVSLNF